MLEAEIKKQQAPKIKISSSSNIDIGSPKSNLIKKTEIFGIHHALINSKEQRKVPVFHMKIIDIKFLGGKECIKLLAFRKKIETGISGSGSTGNPTFGMVQTTNG